MLCIRDGGTNLHDRTEWRRPLLTRLEFHNFKSYFELPRSSDPSSVRCETLLGLHDLDRMGEDY